MNDTKEYIPEWVGPCCEYVASQLDDDRPCDNTLKHTSHWLKEHRYDNPRLIEWIESHGGHCDCEVLLNVWPLLPDSDGA